MKICFMCDLHLPADHMVLQYETFRWAIANVREEKPDCIIFAGDASCDGTEAVYREFLQTVENTGIPFFYIPGNSDLRCPETRDAIWASASKCKNKMEQITIFAINDSDRSIPDEQLALLEEADEESIVFMHHPIATHDEQTVKRLEKWRATHPKTMLFYAHFHRWEAGENFVALPSMDPDKAIGECPCITYYDTETKSLRKAHFDSPMPEDLDRYFGISCYRPMEHIQFAAAHKLKYLELRPNCANEDSQELKLGIDQWRAAGGENLSVHFPDFSWADGEIVVPKEYTRLIAIVRELKANRITVHTPKVSVQAVKDNPQMLEQICAYFSEDLNRNPHELVVGVENFHMKGDRADDSRRYGCLPEECLEFMNLLGRACRHKVGINFDIGHARNNLPYSQKYQIGTWMSLVGKYTVGYHIHQVRKVEENVFENHVAITDVYGPMISYASYFHYWTDGRINKAPMIFEMRPENAYAETLKTFFDYKQSRNQTCDFVL